MLCVNATVWQDSFCPHWTEPFISNSVTICCVIPPVIDVSPLKTFLPKELLILTSAPEIGLLSVEFVTFTSRYHWTVRLFVSTGLLVLLGTNCILDLLNETFRKKISVTLEVKITSA